MKIAINAGHCPGLDPGAVGEFVTEADIVREISLMVETNLKNEGHETLFIQEDELADICAIANDAEADIFVSVHCNAANHVAHGTETFFYQEGDESYSLAGLIQSNLVFDLGTTDRGIKDGSWLYVLRNTDMTAVLVEVGFIDNPYEEQLIISKKHQIASAISDGILEFIDTL